MNTHPVITPPDGGLDAATAERLLVPSTATEPAEHPPLAGLLAAAAALGPSTPPAGEEAALAAFRSVMGERSATKHRTERAMSPTKARLLSAIVAGGLTVGGGVAAAATGALPDVAQQTAQNMLGQLGVDVPGPDDAARDHGSDNANDSQDPGRGEEVSQTARTTTETGADKGALVSDVASDGRSHAGEDHGEGQPATGQPPSKPATPTGNTDASRVGDRPHEG